MAKKGTLPLRNSLIRKSFLSSNWVGGSGVDGGGSSPTGLTVLENTGGEITLSWPIQDGIGNYGIFYSTNCDNVSDADSMTASGTYLGQSDKPPFTFSPISSGLISGNSYCFNVIYGQNPPFDSFSPIEITIQEPPPLYIVDANRTLFLYNPLDDTSTPGDTFLGVGYSRRAISANGSPLTYTLCVSESNELNGTPAEIIANADFISTDQIGPQSFMTEYDDLKLGTTYNANIVVSDEQGNKEAYDMITAQTKNYDIQEPSLPNRTINTSPDKVDAIKVSFTKATDNVTPQAGIKYEVYGAGPFYEGYSINFETVSDIESNGTKMGEAVNVSEFVLDNLPLHSIYAINIIAIDEEGNKESYDSEGGAVEPFAGGIYTFGIFVDGTTIDIPIVPSSSSYTPVTYTLYYVQGDFPDSFYTSLDSGTPLSDPSLIAYIESGVIAGTTTDGTNTFSVSGLSANTQYAFALIGEDNKGNKSICASSNIIVERLTTGAN